MRGITGRIWLVVCSAMLVCGCRSSVDKTDGEPKMVFLDHSDARWPTRRLPEEARAYWGQAIGSYSFSPSDELFSKAKRYDEAVAVFDGALAPEKRAAVAHLRPLDAVAEVYGHYLEYYDTTPSCPLDWWVLYKLGVPTWGVMDGDHVETVAEGPEALGQLDEALKRAAADFDPKGGVWSYGVARGEYEPGKFRQVVVFAEKRIEVEDFKKSYETGESLSLAGRVLHPGRTYEISLSEYKPLTMPLNKEPTKEYAKKELAVDAEGRFTVSLPLPTEPAVVRVSINKTDDAKDVDSGRLFLLVYVGRPEPEEPEQNLFHQLMQDLFFPPQLKCEGFDANIKSVVGEKLPSEPTAAEIREALKPVRARIKECSTEDEGARGMGFVVDGSGRVRSVSGMAEEGNAGVNRCIGEAVCGTVFPRFEDPPLRLQRSFEL